MLLTDIQKHGAHAVVAKLWSTDDRWNKVMRSISRGSTQWLRVAVALRSGTDGGASETLDEAIFLALKPEPIAVLALLREHKFDTEFVCSSNVATDYPADSARRLIRDRIRALTTVSEPRMAAIRDHCLKRLKAAASSLVETVK